VIARLDPFYIIDPRMTSTAPPDIDGFSEIFLSMEENLEGKAKKSS